MHGIFVKNIFTKSIISDLNMLLTFLNSVIAKVRGINVAYLFTIN